MIVFFDLSSNLLSRYPKYISDVYYSDRECSLFTLEDVLENGSRWTSAEFWRDVDEIVICGHRLPDIILALLAAKYSVPVSYIQHGIFDRRLQRTLKGLARLFFKKGLNYWRFFKLYKGRSRIFLGITLVLAALYDNRFARKALGFSKSVHWKAWYLNETSEICQFEEVLGAVGLETEIFRIDFDKSRFDVGPVEKNCAAIFLQSFVEDGRMDPSMYRDRLFRVLQSLGKDFSLIYLISHPRSDIALYKDALAVPSVFWVKNDSKVPRAAMYLSDYSSMLLVAKNLGFPVKRIIISGHKTITEIEEIEPVRLS